MKIYFPVTYIWHWFKAIRLRVKIAAALLILGVFIIVIPVITYAYFARDISEPERLMNRNNTGIALLDQKGEPFYSFGHVGTSDNVTLEQISDDFEHALLASEDENFYDHVGLSARGVVSAMYANALSRDATKYGGSTITQQLVKNTLLSSNKSFLRKYQEVSIAVAIERHYSKDEILQMYINSVYYGEGAFGIKQAAKIYFNKDPDDLNVAEASMLVGLLPAPSAFSPISGDAAKAKIQQKRVLDRMVEAGHIKEDQRRVATEQQLAFAKTVAEEKHAQHFAMMVLDELKNKYGEETIIRGGYRVTTGLDLNWQKKAEQLVRERVAELNKQGARNASMVAIDPRTGEIRALVGSANWSDETYGKVNMALAPRQPGSSFKPIYYTEALDKKIITPATIIRDEPKVYGGNYKPQNFDFRFRGDISVRRALGQSLNIPSIEVMQKLGVAESVTAAQRMGIDDVNDPAKYGLSLALGTAEAELLDMTNAYAAFANQGNQYPLINVKLIKDKFDNTIFEAVEVPKRVQSAEASFLISSVLSDNEARAPTFGASLNIPNRQVAVKTGTTDDYRDAWTIGYTPSLTVGVWAGNNDSQPMNGVGGSIGAGSIWRNSMMSFLGDSKPETFSPPPDVVKLIVCRNNGLKADKPSAITYDEFFIKGGEPTGKCESSRSQETKKEEKKEDENKKKQQNQEDQNSGSDGDETSEEGGRGSSEPINPPTEPTEPAPEPEPGPVPEPDPEPEPPPATESPPASP